MLKQSPENWDGRTDGRTDGQAGGRIKTDSDELEDIAR